MQSQMFLVEIVQDQTIITLESLHADPLLRESLKVSGYQAWQERFTWEKIAAQYERLYRGLVG